MKNKSRKELSSQHLVILRRDLKKLEKAQKYLEKERQKLMKEKTGVMIKIRKEKEVLRLQNQIRIVKNRKK